MRRFLGVFVCLFAFAVVAQAEEYDRKILTITTTDATATDTVSTVRGAIEEIAVDVVTAGTTGSVLVVAQPEVSTMSDVTLVSSNGLTADYVFRPRVDATDTSGVPLTSDPPGRFILAGETIRFEVSSASATGRVFKAVIKYTKK